MFNIELTPSAIEDLRYLKKYEQQMILDTLEMQLKWEPSNKTKKRRPLRPNDLSSWEPRVGKFRIF